MKRFLNVVPLIFAYCILVLGVSCIYGGTWLQYCPMCGSARRADKDYLGRVQKETITRQGAGFSTCTHVWQETGLSELVSMVTYPATVKNDRILLVRQHGQYAAVRIRQQHGGVASDSVTFDWWYRKDGKGRFDEPTGRVFSGSSTDEAIRFADMKVEWSAGSEGEGYLYLFHPIGTVFDSKDAFLCLTEATSIEGVDAADPKWKYL